MSEVVKHDVFMVTYESKVDGSVKKALVMAEDANDANQYVKKMPKCDQIRVPAVKMASGVHVVPGLISDEDNDEFSVEIVPGGKVAEVLDEEDTVLHEEEDDVDRPLQDKVEEPTKNDGELVVTVTPLKRSESDNEGNGTVTPSGGYLDCP